MTNTEPSLDLDAEIERLRSALLVIRRIGAQSGTKLDSWNEVFDVIDSVLATSPDPAYPRK